MIDPELRIDEYYKNKINELLKYRSKYTNLNFSRLPEDKKLVQLTIDVTFDSNLVIRDKIDWDLKEEKKSPDIFVRVLLENLKHAMTPESIEYNRKFIRNQILDQLLEHVEKYSMLPKFKVVKRESETPGTNQLCDNCGTLIFNPDFCVNCMQIFERKIEKKTQSITETEKVDDLRQTDRQRILELRQKNISIDDAESDSQIEKDNKVCKKCGEVNPIVSNECKECRYKFPIIHNYDITTNQNYSIHFWEKINKNQIIQQLKTFSDFFTKEDFSSLKFLYKRIKEVVSTNFEEILTEEAIIELHRVLDKNYFAFSNQTTTVLSLLILIDGTII